jgi:hypothetical protein
MHLRYETRAQRIMRLMLAEFSTEEIGRKLRITGRTVRYACSLPSFQTAYQRLEKEHFEAVDRKMACLLREAVRALRKQLRHKDWRARDRAIEHVLRLHGKFVERYDISGRLSHTGQVSHQHQLGTVPLDDMIPEARQLARRLLEITRQTRQLPPRFSQSEEDTPSS